MLTDNVNASLDLSTTEGFPWQTIYIENGITFKAKGKGINLVLIPGLEGSGESCLHLVLPVLERALSDSMPYRLILVDYSHEQHPSLAELVGSIDKGLFYCLQNDPCVLWAQSFGNLLATGIIAAANIKVTKIIMVSPFTNLPALLSGVSVASLYLTPTFLYRATIKPLGRFFFGPTGKNRQHPFFQSLVKATSSQVKRQTKWLVNKDFSEQFTSIKLPCKAWLGEKDRLVNIKKQIEFFAGLANLKTNFYLTVIPDCGHVVLPGKAIDLIEEELYDWLMANNR